ncbi:hypothetical protein [Glycomyces albidus]|uniref:Uncharacterized protein n=1 Tax=Glycomyces albidus TaxID=2656774 RepID=A0A6L5G7X2_9ACTN|nr:hypothetical protein [Glycomyces albidus]MQM25737.1 hypothetical protein [Glycomyces albidus]
MTEPMDAGALLRAADAALRTLGFDVEPAPLVVLGPAQRTAIAMAGPFGGLIEAALQAQAAAGTLGLQALAALAGAADAAALLAPADPPRIAGGQGER